MPKFFQPNFFQGPSVPDARAFFQVEDEEPVPPEPPIVIHVGGGGRRFTPFPNWPWAYRIPKMEDLDQYVTPKDVHVRARILTTAAVESVTSRESYVRPNILHTPSAAVDSLLIRDRVNLVLVTSKGDISSEHSVEKAYTTFVSTKINVYSAKTTKVVDELWLLGLSDDSDEDFLLR